MFWGVVVTADCDEVVADVVLLLVLSEVVVASVLFLLSCPPQEEIQKSATANKGIKKEFKYFIVVGLK
jgi:hypothetical protein